MNWEGFVVDLTRGLGLVIWCLGIGAVAGKNGLGVLEIQFVFFLGGGTGIHQRVVGLPSMHYSN